MAISTEQPTATLRRRTTEAPPGTSLQQLIDTGTLYVAQNLNPTQFATLQAIASRLFAQHHDPHHPNRSATSFESPLQATSGYMPAFRHSLPVGFDYQLGLDELDSISRTRAGYAFAELPAEIQDAILDLISTGDLTTLRLNIASWLEVLQATAYEATRLPARSR